MKKDEGRIVIEPEDLPSDEGERIVIRPEDLAEEQKFPPEPRVFSPSSPPVAAEVTSAPYGLSLRTFLSSSIALGALLGFVGGFLGWLVVEPFIADRSGGVPFLRAVGESALTFGVVGGVLGAALGAVDGLMAEALLPALHGAGMGLAVGSAGGLLGGAFGQIAYSLMGGGMAPDVARQIVARALGWALVASVAGMAQGARLPSWGRVRNGALGGLAGGLAGGVLFDPIGMIVGGGELSRAVAITLIGLCTGLAVAVVEELLKEAWLTVTSGPLAGKRFILYRNPTVIGSSPKNDIPLMKDPEIFPQHAAIGREGRLFVLYDLSGGRTLVNGSPVRRGVLRRGDLIRVGMTQLRFEGVAQPGLG